MIIAIDFDGYLCGRAYPDIGKPHRFRIWRVKRWKRKGHTIILWTCRGDMPHAEKLTEAVEWCRQFGLEFDYINENDPKRVELFGGESRKVSADMYYDDRNGFVWRCFH